MAGRRSGNRRRILAAGLALLCGTGVATPVRAASKAGTTAFSFLTVPTGARPAAMGESFTSVPNDVQGIFYNPDLLSSLVSSQLSVQHLSHVQGILFDSLSFAQANGDSDLSWGGNVLYSRVGDIPETVADASVTDGFRTTGNFSTSDMLAGFSFAGRPTLNVALGTGLKIFREDLGQAQSNAVAADFGFLYQGLEEPFWNFGMAVQNIGFASKFSEAAVPMPMLFRAGLSGQPFSQWLWSVDYLRGVALDNTVSVGAEVSPAPVFSLRFGYQYAMNRPELGDLAGLGAGAGFHWEGGSLDYAFVPLGDLGFTHRVTVTFRFLRND